MLYGYATYTKDGSTSTMCVCTSESVCEVLRAQEAAKLAAIRNGYEVEFKTTED